MNIGVQYGVHMGCNFSSILCWSLGDVSFPNAHIRNCCDIHPKSGPLKI